MNCIRLLFVQIFEVDEEKKVEAVREFYANVLGDFNAVQKLQLISIASKASFSVYPDTAQVWIPFR